MWEKYWGLHQAHYLKRVLIRLPIGILLWFIALMIPFFGPLNSIIGSLFMSFSVFIIPAVAYNITFWNPKAREVQTFVTIFLLKERKKERERKWFIVSFSLN